MSIETGARTDARTGATTGVDIDDVDACYRVVKGRDRRFDGLFYIAVTSTGIYCRPSCPAITPKRANARFFRTSAAAQGAGFRACRRCLPDAVPGSPQWDVAGDVTGRAMRLIADGVVERDGVDGLASRLGYTSRHLNRLLTERVGASPLALARARRASAARVLVETTAMPMADIAFAAGFASIRQFNDTVREVYASTPSELRSRTGSRRPGGGGIGLRLAVRRPFDTAALLDFLAARAVPRVEQVAGTTYTRTLSLPHGHGLVSLDLAPVRDDGYVRCHVRLADLRDLTTAVERGRRLLDADADPVAVDAELGADALLAAAVAAHPGLRVPGHVDGAELAVRAVVGQQVSVAGARTTLGRIVAGHGVELDPAVAEPDGPDLVFPDSATLAQLPAQTLPMPRTRGRTVVTLATALAEGRLRLDRGEDRGAARAALLDLPGIGAWTAGYIALRALGDPDVLLAGDLGVRDGLGRLTGTPDRPSAARVEQVGARWRPWRSYAQMHLWRSPTATPTTTEEA